MAATTMATAAGAMVLLYYVLARRLSSSTDPKSGTDNNDDEGYNSKSRRKIRPAQAPATWFETMTTLSETLRFTYSETLGKWPLGDLAFGINYLLRRQGNVQVASVYAGENCVQLKGPEIVVELKYYLWLLTLGILFSKKPFPVFLESAGFSEADVLLQKPKAGILKPAFTIICDKKSKCFLLLIRGTHSIKDTLTAATGAVVPFHHSVIHDGGISNLILGYAHCGMVAAARWIAKLSIPSLLEALKENPGYEVKVVGHSLGGGTAALLTYILREQKDLSSISCITFAPAACMTWELAESGKHFITTIINGSDLVPTFSTASIDDLRTEVTASSWLNDLRDQVEQTRVLNVVFRSATALGSRLPSMANARAKVAGAGAMLRPVSSSTQVVMKRAQNVAQAVVRTRSTLSAWSCMGARRRPVGNAPTDDFSETSLILEKHADSLTSDTGPDHDSNNIDHCSSSGGSGSGHDDSDEEELLIPVDHTTSKSEHITEGELLYELEKELQRQENEAHIQAQQEEEEAAAEEIIEEEKVIADSVDAEQPLLSSDNSENYHLYPPGRIMHIVSIMSNNPVDQEQDHDHDHDTLIEEHEHENLGIYETPRELYGKLRLSRTMINDHYMPMYKKMMEKLLVELEKQI
ncbi:mono-/di-acylglycerol lipase,Lipase, class 3 [Artemisia annua]|uniref:Mono-/di-acylglycerol lipase,Lipase, class 3 n=1 Tax=Artemisia annua TaxID=35608 RepID=A0A2U1P4B2_ARTAN|nr:mono-/di-acylglycerol lipase,Lipase, class 3 [Artemisia annua]